MSHAGHKIVKCSCGKIIMQCRCADANKPIEVVPNGCVECSGKKEAPSEPVNSPRQNAFAVYGDEPTFDASGYPTDETEREITEWTYEQGYHSLMAYVCRAWKYPTAFSIEGDEYRLSTGGWSGNEQLIGALERNRVFWALCWKSSNRGGHHVFTVPAPSVELAPKSDSGSGYPQTPVSSAHPEDKEGEQQCPKCLRGYVGEDCPWCGTFIGKPEPPSATTRHGQNELLPCPHCGETPTLRSRLSANHRDRDWSITCETPGCFNFVTTGSRYKIELVASWNKRAEISVSEDTKRLDWLERTQTSIGYNVEACAWGVDFEAPYGRNIREGIDAGIERDDVDRRDSSGARNATPVTQKEG